MSRRHDDPYADVTWIGVLRSVAAAQTFRATAAAGGFGPAALHFLLKDPQFPRSVEHCLTELSRALIELPNHEDPMTGCALVQRMLEDVDVLALDGPALHRFVDDLQEGVADVHDRVAASYFRVSPTESEPLAVR